MHWPTRLKWVIWCPEKTNIILMWWERSHAFISASLGFLYSILRKEETRAQALLNLIFLARSGSKTRACFLINTRTKSHDFVNCMTAQGRSSQIIPRAVQEQGLSHAGKCLASANVSGIVRRGEMAALCWVRDRGRQQAAACLALAPAAAQWRGCSLPAARPGPPSCAAAGQHATSRGPRDAQIS